MLGADQVAEVTDFLREYFNSDISRYYTFPVLAALWPITSVVAGELVCISAAWFVNYQTNNLKAQARNDAERAVERTVEALKDEIDT